MWYSKLKGEGPHVLNNNYEKTEDSIIISDQVPFGDKYTRKFAAFKNFNEFRRWYGSTLPEERTFFETIPGEDPQKVYFDIDIKPPEGGIDHEGLVISLKTAIVEEVRKFCSDVSSEDIIVFTSTRESDTDKISYHVVLNNYYVVDSRINGELCRRIRGKLKEEFRQYVDILYSSLQQFRLLFSRKRETNRVKILCTDLTDLSYDNQIDLLRYSLISFVGGCQRINVIYDDYFYLEKANRGATTSASKKDFVKKEYISQDIVIPDESIETLSRIVREKLPNFQLMDTEVSNIFHLRRLSNDIPCLECKRIHDNENSYIYVNRIGSVFFNCFRRKNENDDESSGVKIGEIMVEEDIFGWVSSSKEFQKLISPNKAAGRDGKDKKTGKAPEEEIVWKTGKKSYQQKISPFSAKGR